MPIDEDVLGLSNRWYPPAIDSPMDREPFEERHFTVLELAAMWKLSAEFVRQLVEKEPGVTEWVRQRPGARRYRVLRVPESVARRLYARAVSKAARAPALAFKGAQR
jgi:hypothetical protein